ncbi:MULTISPECIES: DegT/DnrJ/EryC1/StrS family aminotransferase [Streptomyces]|uniref:DegT/DnrJ/EryC1/StrS family aminotransferase n=1 Tax=Streptomyces TaxID=1883 RepID=UPI00287F6451|nr:DegT/DnrJ/EryC1/StrS family aminotransferase [Streptomyces sp. CGMCC 4.1456]WNF65730.1 DegT/DnrJ/EryC1/StrS family aminotransferase [Streptomyces sp. CGMCC 4.1456]
MIKTPAFAPDHSWHLFPVLAAGGAADRDALLERPAGASGVETDVYYPVLTHRQKKPVRERFFGQADLPRNQWLHDRVLLLPLHAGLSLGEQDRVVEALYAATDGGMTDTLPFEAGGGADPGPPPRLRLPDPVGWVAFSDFDETYLAHAATPGQRAHLTALEAASMIGGVAAGPVLGKGIELAGADAVPVLLALPAAGCLAAPWWLIRATREGPSS